MVTYHPTPRARYAAMVTHMDRGVGEILALLEELGIADDTLVLFTSDNGGHGPVTSMAPLRGAKGMLYEGGIRVPMIAWWPGTVPSNTMNATPFAFWDVLPTFCDLAGTPAPDGLDGSSFAADLRDADHQPGDLRHLFWRYQEKSAIRHGKWKAVRPAQDAPIELYDLESDPGESHDLAESHPDVARRLADAMDAATR